MRYTPLASVLLLAGCAAGSSMVARQTYLDAVASCDARFPAIVGGYERRAYCSNAALFARASSLGGSIESMEPVAEANLVNSHLVDTGALSPADYTVQMQEAVDQAKMIDVEEHEERRERNAEATNAMVAGMAASAASRPPPPVYMPPPIVRTTCNRLGNQTTCTTQ